MGNECRPKCVTSRVHGCSIQLGNDQGIAAVTNVVLGSACGFAQVSFRLPFEGRPAKHGRRDGPAFSSTVVYRRYRRPQLVRTARESAALEARTRTIPDRHRLSATDDDAQG